MATLLEPIRRHPVAAYVVLAWGLSWAYWIPMAMRGEVVTPGASTGVSHFPGLMGPLVAALVVTALTTGRRGLLDYASRAFRWRVGLRWYLAAALPMGIFLIGVALVAATGGEVPTIGDLGEFSGLPATLGWPLLILAVLVGNGFGEEGGWRGYLVPSLLRTRGPFTTSLLVAAVWFTWHVPSFGVIETYRNLGAGVVPMMGIGLVCGAIILTWLYVSSGGSILIVALWHLALNFASATTAGRGMAGIVVYNGIIVWAVAVSVMWLVADEPVSRPFLSRLRDGSLIALMRSPFRRFLGGMTVITFTARRSGRTLRTPVECVRDAGQLFVLVDHADLKQWWRNVQANPEVMVQLDGREIPGRAIVHTGGGEASARDLAIYLAHRPRVARILGVPMGPNPDPRAIADAAARSVSVRVDLGSAGAG